MRWCVTQVVWRPQLRSCVVSSITSARSTDIEAEIVIVSVVINLCSAIQHLWLTQQYKESPHLMTLGNWNGRSHHRQEPERVTAIADTSPSPECRVSTRASGSGPVSYIYYIIPIILYIVVISYCYMLYYISLLYYWHASPEAACQQGRPDLVLPVSWWFLKGSVRSRNSRKMKTLL